MSKLQFALPPMQAKMTAVGQVVNPDGSKVDFTLKADMPLKLEGETNGNNPVSSGLNSRD